MSFLKKHKIKIITALAVAAVLAAAFLWSGCAPSTDSVETERSVQETSLPKKTHVPAEEEAQEESDEEQEEQAQETAEAEEDISEEIPIKQPDEEATEENKPVRADNKPLTAEEKTEAARQMAENAPQTYSVPKASGNSQNQAADKAEPQPIDDNAAEITDEEKVCTLSVRCDTVLENIAWLDSEKREIIPSDGVIFPEQEVVFYDGESVFDLLRREMKKNKIHMEFTSTPIYGSAYIEGINNLYEYDCGELSGWMYKVNDIFPSYGCSRYALKDGDRVEFVYTCNLGIDVGGYNGGEE